MGDPAAMCAPASPSARTRSSARASARWSSARSPGSRSSWTTSRSSAWRNGVAALASSATIRWPATASRSASRSSPGVEPAGVGEQPWASRPAGGEQAQHLLRGLGEALDPQHQRVAQRGRQRAAPVEPGGEQLLGEQRVALAARVQALDQVGVGRAAEDVGERLGELVARQPAQLDPARAGVALELGEQRPQRVAAVQLVGAVGGDNEHALAARLRARKARKARVERSAQWRSSSASSTGCSRPSRSSSVSSASNSRACGGRRARRRPAAPRRRARAAARRARARAAGELVEHRVVVAGERAQRADDRGVGQLALAQLDALADSDTRRPRGPGRELGDQARLADARLAGHEGERRTAVGGGVASAASSSASSAVRPMSRLLVTRVAMT